jgi:hypothetical protein
VIARCTFMGPQAGIQNTPLFGVSDTGHETGERNTLDGPKPWRLAADSRAAFELAMRDALVRGRGYPEDAGKTMLLSLPWEDGLPNIIEARSPLLRLTLTELTCRLLPELAPVGLEQGRVVWLDTLVPTLRTLHHIARRTVPRVSEASLAILYQSEAVFEQLADDIERRLSGAIRRVDKFPGDTVASPGSRVALLQQVFFEHSAVLFLGHLKRPGTSSPGGWALTNSDALSMPEIQALLGSARLPRETARNRLSLAAPPIPELIATVCCCGAWGDPGTFGPTDLFYPSLFLDRGVRFFVGSWMDVVVRTGASDPDLSILTNLFGEFLRRWSSDKNRAAEHLHAAKAQCGFPLLSSLFQIYGGLEFLEPKSETDAKRAVEVETPSGALVSRLREGQEIGEFRLGQQLWQDRYAVTYWAEENGRKHFLQVLADEWQADLSLPSDLEIVIADLGSTAVTDGHLVPARVARLQLPDAGPGFPSLVALIYDRPFSEEARDWSCLATRRLDRERSDHYQQVLELGAQISGVLWQLHEKKILHGNFDPGCVVFLKASRGESPFIKDTWVHRVRPGRCTDARYAAPEESEQMTGSSQLKQDAWGLGMVLFELAIGHAPEGTTSVREAAGTHADRVPEALDRVVKECLVPSAVLRPSAELVARRLALARDMGGTYIDDLEEQFDQAICAGHRLFVVRVDETAELETILEGMQNHPRAKNTIRTEGRSYSYKYRLFVAEEGTGIVDRKGTGSVERHRGTTVVPWRNDEYIQALYAGAGAPPIALEPPQVAGWNGVEILEWVSSKKMSVIPRAATGHDEQGETLEVPVLLIAGMDWWETADSEQAVYAWRVLKEVQRQRNGPVVIIADSVIRPIGDTPHRFQVLDFPPPSPSELFERVLAAPQDLSCDALTPEQAAEIAGRLFPCRSMELNRILRLGALRYGRVDERVVGIRDEERARLFRGAGVMSYVPSSMLPELSEMAWPPSRLNAVLDWVQGMRADGMGPRRLLLTGAAGSGKSFGGRVLAGALGIPLIRVEASRCLQGLLGDSERTLRLALDAASRIGMAVVLLDDLDVFFGSVGAEDSATNAVLSRLSSILLDWLDSPLGSLIVIATAKSEEAFSPQWRRRIEFRIQLDQPPLDLNSDESLKYRAAVMRAIFSRFKLLLDQDFIADLARETHPEFRSSPLRAPEARATASGPLSNLSIELHNGAEIEDWIAGTILCHSPLGNVKAAESKQFWRDAIS